VAAKLRVTQVKSTISHVARNRATVRALGLHGIGSTSVVTDNPATRGMVCQVRFLVTVEEIAEPGSDSVAAQPSERAPRVRARGRGRANAGTSRSSGDQAADQEKV
jgi:large subunit ribosomal protein L30